MIQRKQTLYLLISGFLLLAILFLPLIKIVVPDMIYAFNASGFVDLSGEIIRPTWILFCVTILSILISFISIFLYTRRVLQMRCTIFNLVLKVGLYVLGTLYYRNFVGSITDLGVEYVSSITPWVAFPLIAVIFDYLAYRGIAIDEQTVRFMDRLR